MDADGMSLRATPKMADTIIEAYSTPFPNATCGLAPAANVWDLVVERPRCKNDCDLLVSRSAAPRNGPVERCPHRGTITSECCEAMKIPAYLVQNGSLASLSGSCSGRSCHTGSLVPSHVVTVASNAYIVGTFALMQEGSESWSAEVSENPPA